MILLLTLIQLIDNFKFQIASFILLHCIVWIGLQPAFRSTFTLSPFMSLGAIDPMMLALCYPTCAFVSAVKNRDWHLIIAGHYRPCRDQISQHSPRHLAFLTYCLDGSNCTTDRIATISNIISIQKLPQYCLPHFDFHISPSRLFPRFVFRDIRNLRWFYHSGSCSRLAIAVRYNFSEERFFFDSHDLFLICCVLIGIPNKSKCLRYQNNWNWVVV